MVRHVHLTSSLRLILRVDTRSCRERNAAASGVYSQVRACVTASDLSPEIYAAASVIASSAAVSSLLRMRKIEKSKCVHRGFVRSLWLIFSGPCRETEYSKGPRSHVLSTKYPLSTIVDLFVISVPCLSITNHSHRSYCDTRTEAHTERLGIQECA